MPPDRTSSRAKGIKGLSQKDRILRLARQRGEQGICQVDFLPPDVADGREPIVRLAARIGELELDGFTFARGGRRKKCQVYILTGARQGGVSAISGPSSGAAAETPRRSSEPADAPASLTLLDDHRPAPASAIYGDDAA